MTGRFTGLLLGLTLAASPAGAQDPIYDRPFVAQTGGGATALGGYLEGNTNYFREDGISEGFSMELRRFNVFLFSSMGSRITFFSELEFEHGTEEIALETALIDFEMSPALLLRAGILLPPLGQFNQNHDSPKWEFVNRPLVSTELIPSTLSEVGFGVHGRVRLGGVDAGYQLYAVNGLGEGIARNSEGRTHIPSGKGGEAFGEDNNGQPAITGRLEARISGRGTIGVGGYSGVYNSWRLEGESVEPRRRVRIVTIDAALEAGSLTVIGEGAAAWIDVPESLGDLYGDGQLGGFVDVIYPVYSGCLGALCDAVINLSVRLEHLDMNVGSFSESGRRIHDEETAVVLGWALRPNAETVFKLNYRYHWQRDPLGNPARLGGVQAGFATYF